MATNVGRVVQHLRHVVEGGDAAALRDGELLDCFIRTQAEDAFAILVERHGPMILGVCRRILQNTHDADDAFQAAFLVLARRAATVRRAESVAAWLHGIALRLALNMKRQASIRHQREQHAILRPPEGPADLGARELHAALDEELQRLPAANRQPLLLCYLEGLTQEAAAHQLGWPRGTLKRRLERGRALLLDRLTKRGLTLGAGLLGTLAAGEALAVPLAAPLASATIRAGIAAATGQAAGTIISAKAAALAEGVIKTMFLTKLAKWTAAVLLVLAGCGLGLAGYSHVAVGDEPDAPPAEKKQAMPVERNKEKAAKLRAQFKAHAADFDITITRHDCGDPKIDLKSITLHSSNLRFEPAAIGPSGKPVSKHARITKAQAVKIIEILDDWPAYFFLTAQDVRIPLRVKGPRIVTEIGCGPDSEAEVGPRLHLAQEHGWHIAFYLTTIRDSVDGEATKLVTELLLATMNAPNLPKKDAKGDRAATVKRFEDLARQLEMFPTQQLAYGRATGRDGLVPKAVTQPWLKVYAAICEDGADFADLVGLLKHVAPKVRTLAMAALYERQDPRMLPYLAAMVSDKENTAPQVQILRAIPGIPAKGVVLEPQDYRPQTVGQVAEALLRRWLDPAGYKLKDFDAYWVVHKDRKFCASWFLARMEHAGQAGTSSFDKSRAPLIRAIRKDIDALPNVDRDWTLLWVAARSWAGNDAGRNVATLEDLLEAGKRLGPDRLMDLLQERAISTDPDLAPTERGLHNRRLLVRWVLAHAGQLLRPTDAPAIRGLEAKLPLSACAIAAAQLHPAHAGEWLDDAMKRTAGDGTHQSWQRAELAAALWRIVGPSQLDYLADWFYGEKVDTNPHTTQLEIFLTAIKRAPAPVNRKLAARLVADPRLDKLDYQSLRALIELVNGWTKAPVVEQHALRPGWEKGTWGPETGRDFQVLTEWRRKLRDSVPEWQLAAGNK